MGADGRVQALAWGCMSLLLPYAVQAAVRAAARTAWPRVPCSSTPFLPGNAICAFLWTVLTVLLLAATSAQAITWADTAWGGLRAGHRTAPPQPVFVRLEAPGEAEAAAAAKQQPKQPKQQKQPKKAKEPKQPKQPKEAKAEQGEQQQEVAVETQTVA